MKDGKYSCETGDDNPEDSFIFSEVVNSVVPGSSPKIVNKRIMIKTKNEDGTVGPLMIPTERVYSFGVPKNSSFPGYSLSLCLYSKDDPTEGERQWVRVFERLVSHCADHLVRNRGEIGKFDLERRDLIKVKGGFNPLYWKIETVKGKNGSTSLQRVPGLGPMLYVKLIYSPKTDEISSLFFNSVTDEVVDPTTLIDKHLYVKGVLKIESIFIGQTISLQVKLHEAIVEEVERGLPRLLL